MIVAREGADCTAFSLCRGGCRSGLDCAGCGYSRIGVAAVGDSIASPLRQCLEDREGGVLLEEACEW